MERDTIQNLLSCYRDPVHMMYSFYSRALSKSYIKPSNIVNLLLIIKHVRVILSFIMMHDGRDGERK